jgi:hypothetical protein
MGWLAGLRSGGSGIVKVPIAAKLVLSFLIIILLTSVTFSIADVRVIGNHLGEEAQARVQTDLHAVQEM